MIYFKNKCYMKTTPPHYYISIPIADEHYLLLYVITSQIENKRSYYSRTNQKALDSLVHIDRNEINILTRPSVIDCNSPIYDLRENIIDLQIRVKSFKIIHNRVISSLTKKE